jgi:hypothetical protein
VRDCHAVCAANFDVIFGIVIQSLSGNFP